MKTQTQAAPGRTAAHLVALKPLRLVALTLLMAFGGTAMQVAHAAPGGHGEHGSYGERGARSDRMDSPRHMQRMLDSVEATPEQRAQIKQIMAAGQADMKAQHEQGKALHGQMAALMAQPTIDARAAEALRQQMLAQHDQVSKQRMQTMLEVSRVLTPEQRQKMASRMEQRRSMMERHRGERQQLEGNRPL